MGAGGRIYGPSTSSTTRKQDIKKYAEQSHLSCTLDTL